MNCICCGIAETHSCVVVLVHGSLQVPTVHAEAESVRFDLLYRFGVFEYCRVYVCGAVRSGVVVLLMRWRMAI